MIDIEPCPYCGFKYPALVVKSQEIDHYRKVSYAYVDCGECHARGPIGHELDSEQYQQFALYSWNDLAFEHQRCEEYRASIRDTF